MMLIFFMPEVSVLLATLASSVWERLKVRAAAWLVRLGTVPLLAE